MTNDKLTLKGIREADFLKKLAQYQSVTNQIEKLEEACGELNKDVRDAFYIAGTSKEGDRTFIHIVTSGKEGEKEARKTLKELSKANDIDIKNKTAERYNEDEPGIMERFIERTFDRKLRENREKLRRLEE